MDDSSRITQARRGGAVFLGFLFLASVYRAATQSITCDEAFSWQQFLSQPVASIFQSFNASNHLLATLSFWVSFHLFGGNEFAMRVPSLLGCAWYLVTIFRLYSRVFRRPLLFLLALGVTTLNPLMLDFMVAARGYGIAVSGLTYAILALLDYLRATDGGRRSLYWAALGIYVSIGSNLSALIPCAMLMFSFLLIVAAARGVKRALLECSLLAMPVAAFLTAIYFVFPLHSANREHFYVGFPDWWQSFRNLIQVSFYHAGYIGDPRGVPPVVSAYLTVVAVVTGALLLWIAARWFRGIAALRRGGTLTESAFLLTAGAMWGSIAILFLAHHLLGLLYPVDRTGLYFLALMPIAVMTGGGRWMPISVFASAMVLIAFACQWNTRFFYVWRFDADTKEIMRVLEQRVGKAAGPVRLGISWPLDPSISFYRATRGDTWMAPVDRRGPDGQYDYYVITPPMTDLKLDDRPVLAKRSLTTIYEGPVSKTVLAIPPP